MRKAAVSFAAALVMFATLAVPANAAKDGDILTATASWGTVSFDASSIPDRLVPGQTVRIVGTIQMADTGTRVRIPLSYSAAIESPFGRAQLRSGTRSIRSGVTKSAPFSFTVDERAPGGDVTLVLQFSANNETITLIKNFTISK
jgi:hypothetical protein